MKKTRFAPLVLAICAVVALGARAAAHPPAETAPLFLSEYGKIHDALASDRTDGVVAAASKLESTARAMLGHADTAEKPLYEAVATAAGQMKGGDIAALRAPMKELSVAVDAFLRAAGTKGWQLYFCPMADGYWIQTAEGVRNPYYGKSMLKCGDKVPGVAKG